MFKADCSDDNDFWMSKWRANGFLQTDRMQKLGLYELPIHRFHRHLFPTFSIAKSIGVKRKPCTAFKSVQMTISDGGKRKTLVGQKLPRKRILKALIGPPLRKCSPTSKRKKKKRVKNRGRLGLLTEQAERFFIRLVIFQRDALILWEMQFELPAKAKRCSWTSLTVGRIRLNLILTFLKCAWKKLTAGTPLFLATRSNLIKLNWVVFVLVLPRRRHFYFRFESSMFA